MTVNYIIKNASIIDGTGKKTHLSDIAIKNDVISAIDHSIDLKSENTIDAKGLIVCPGFIDCHSHSDLYLNKNNQSDYIEPLIRQGITTTISGNCGIGLAPVSDEFKEEACDYIELISSENIRNKTVFSSIKNYMDYISKMGTGINCGFLAPHGMIRIAATGFHKKTINRDDVLKMALLLDEELEAGAFGLSTGLMYAPGSFAGTEELAALGKKVARKNGIVANHLRSYSNTIYKALDEIKQIGKISGAKVHVSHLFYLPQFSRFINSILYSGVKKLSALYNKYSLNIPADIDIKRILKRIKKINRGGVHMTVDLARSSVGCTHALAFFPPSLFKNNIENIIELLKDKDVRNDIYKKILKGRSKWPHTDDSSWSLNYFRVLGFDSFYIMSSGSYDKQIIGKSITQIARERDNDPFNTLCDLIIEGRGRLIVYFTPTYPGDPFIERTVLEALKDDSVSISTDAVVSDLSMPHFLHYDCYPGFIKKYVLDRKHLTFEKAVRKCTSLPASQMNIKRRGEIKEGFFADIVIMNPDKLKSLNSPEKPDIHPEGIEYVFVNGRPVLTPEGYDSKNLSGRVLRHD